jgi:probable rRNA maturation factor
MKTKTRASNTTLEIDIQYALDDQTALPQTTDFSKWVGAALSGRKEDAQLSIRIVDETESTYLNETYRHKTGPTNVLSFPAEYSAEIPISLIGDIVICAPIVIKEAQAQGKNALAHWAHMTIHGTLHLLGFDHDNDNNAEKMESIEINILKQLGFDNPY